MPKETKFFTGGMDTDSEDRLLPRDRYRYAFMLNFNQRDGKAGVGYKENGNVLVPYTLPAGDNECIGSKEHIANGSIIYFVHNSLGNHGIYEFFPDTNTIEPILINDILNFSLDRRIHSINVFDDNLAWCDDLAPKHLIISSAKAHTAGTASTADVFAYDSLLATGTQEQKAQFITAGAYPPLYAPFLAFLTDSAKSSTIKRNLYQFAYRYVYFDNTRSSLSPYSKISKPEGNDKLNNYDGSIKNNVVEVTFNTGHPNVKSIEVYVREGNISSWLLADIIEKYDLSNTSIIADYITLSIEWYGETSVSLPDAELVNFYQIPLTAKAQTLSYNNVLFYGNYISGYDLVDVDVTSNVVSTEVTSPLLLNGVEGEVPFDNTVGFIEIREFYDNLDAGDFCYFQFNSNETGAIDDTFTYKIPNPKQATYAEFETDVVTHLNPILFNAGYNTGGFTTAGIGGITKANGNFFFVRVYYDSIVLKKIVSFKSGTTQRIGIVYYDEQGRHSGVHKIDDITIPLYLEVGVSNIPFKTYINEIELEINHLPPDYAKSYQIVTAGSDLNFYIQGTCSVVNTGYDFNGKTTILFSADSLFDNIIDFSGVDYEFVEGDLLRVIGGGLNSIPNFRKLYEEDIVLEILFYDTANKQIVAELIPELNLKYLSGGYFIEIIRKSTFETEIYREVGEVRGVEGGFHLGDGVASNNQTDTQPAGIILGFGDTYVQAYQYGTGVDKFYIGYETMYYSRFFSSSYTDLGRFHVYDSSIKQVNLSNHFIYGGRYFEDTQTNRLFEFSANNDNVVSSEYGEIRKLVSVQYTVKVLQDKRISSAYLNRQVAVNPGGSDSVVLSDKFVAEIRPYPMEMGTQHPESVVLQNRYLYMWDARNGFAIRDDANGPDSISKHNFMTGSRRLSGEYNNKRIFGSYDESNDRVLWTFGDTTKSETVVFEPTTQLWRGFTHYHPEQYISIGMVFISFKNGNLWVHNDEFNQGMLYGDSYDAIIETVFNENPKNIKTGLSIAVHSNKPWAAPNKGDISTEDTNMYGTQETRILANRFEYQDRVFYADIPRDMNTPNVVAPIINGDKLQGAIFKVRLTNGDLGEVKIFAIDLNYLNNTEI